MCFMKFHLFYKYRLYLSLIHILATADGTTIKTYANDNAMRGLLLDKLRGSELLVVNRAEAVNDDY